MSYKIVIPSVLSRPSKIYVMIRRADDNWVLRRDTLALEPFQFANRNEYIFWPVPNPPAEDEVKVDIPDGFPEMSFFAVCFAIKPDDEPQSGDFQVRSKRMFHYVGQRLFSTLPFAGNQELSVEQSVISGGQS